MCRQFLHGEFAQLLERGRHGERQHDLAITFDFCVISGWEHTRYIDFQLKWIWA